ncbi:MAG: tripartite tricarboxylate transporter substrate binding protein [Bacillota bacterium]
MRKKAAQIAASILTLALLLSGCAQKPAEKPAAAPAPATQTEAAKPAAPAFPTGPVEIVVGASPGGGWDTTARVVQKVLGDTKLVTQPINVVNRPGGGGQVAWSYLNEHKGNGHYLSMNSTQLFPPQLIQNKNMKFEDFTPLAMLTTEYLALAVRADSPYKTGKEFLDVLKQDPAKLSVGIGSGVASNDQISFLKAAKSYGVDVKKVRIVLFSSGADQMTAILGGNVDAVSTGISEAIEQAKAGKLRIIATTAPKRLAEAPDVPTWDELGIDGTFRHWRGIMGPGGMTPEQIAAWDDIFSKMVKSEAWQKELANRGWTDAYLGSKEFSEYLKQNRAEFETLLKETGVIK